MDRPITGFVEDEARDWIAELSCGHRQHVRHKPPFTLRPWVVTEEGRASKLGASLGCDACDRLERPPAFEPYKRTPTFTERTVPAALLGDHTTRRGVWANIVVLEGALRYHVPALSRTFDLAPDASGVVAPEVPHRVETVGAVRFFVEFYRAPTSASDRDRGSS
jgi:tellurite methyltransferase